MSPSIRKLTGRIGAVVGGVDFTAPPDLSTITTLRPENILRRTPRRLNRVTVAVGVPVGVDGRRCEQLVGDASHHTGVLEAAA